METWFVSRFCLFFSLQLQWLIKWWRYSPGIEINWIADFSNRKITVIFCEGFLQLYYLCGIYMFTCHTIGYWCLELSHGTCPNLSHTTYCEYVWFQLAFCKAPNQPELCLKRPKPLLLSLSEWLRHVLGWTGCVGWEGHVTGVVTHWMDLWV